MRGSRDQVPENLKQLEQIRWLSRLLDNSIKIPGSNYRIGIDPLLGLIPGIGDLIGSALSSYIILLAVSANVSPWTLTRMAFNVLLESMVGALPLVGDLFDAVWKANERNRRLLEASLQNPRREKLDRRFVVLVFIALGAVFVFSIWLALRTLAWLIQYFNSASQL